jgi:hypothetical protein
MPGGTPKKEKWAMVQRWFLATLLVIGCLGLAGLQTDGQPLSSGQLTSDMPEKGWINSPPLAVENLRGHVVLLEFWTYG